MQRVNPKKAIRARGAGGAAMSGATEGEDKGEGDDESDKAARHGDVLRQVLGASVGRLLKRVNGHELDLPLPCG